MQTIFNSSYTLTAQIFLNRSHHNFLLLLLVTLLELAGDGRTHSELILCVLESKIFSVHYRNAKIL